MSHRCSCALTGKDLCRMNRQDYQNKDSNIEWMSDLKLVFASTGLFLYFTSAASDQFIFSSVCRSLNYSFFSFVQARALIYISKNGLSFGKKERKP